MLFFKLNKTYLYALYIALFSFYIIGCSHLFPERNIEFISHPKIQQARVLCNDCHDGESDNFGKNFEHFSHTPRFIEQHKSYSAQDYKICNICHKDNFCSDCHSNKDTLKPNFKKGDRPDKTYPHKGNYIIRHRFEGKNFSSKCFGCHGRKNNEKCKRCHK